MRINLWLLFSIWPPLTSITISSLLWNSSTAARGIWLILEPEPVSKPPHLCVRQNKPLSPTKTIHREVWNPTKTNFSHVKKNSEWCSRHFTKFWSEEMRSPSFPDMTPMDSVCVFWRQMPILLHTQVWRLLNGLWFENVPKYLMNTNRAAVNYFQRRLDMVIDVKKDHIENEVTDWFLCMFPIILYNFFLLFMRILN